jgi:hypothetical protein
MHLAEIKANQSATEKARAGIAGASPYMICLLLGSYVVALSTGTIPESAIAASSALLTLVLTALMQNLRSIISESNGNGHDEDEDKDKDKDKDEDKPKPKTKPKD